MIEKQQTPYYFVDLLKRTSDVIELIAEKDTVSIADLSRLLGQERNSVNRIVQTLADLDYLTRRPDKRFCLTLKLFRLGSQVLARTPVSKLVHPGMQSLASMFGETVCLGQMSGQDVVIIDLISGISPVHYVSHVGNTMPLQNTALGKSILAAQDAQNLKSLMAKLDYRQGTEKSIKNEGALLEELEKIRKQGFAFDDEEWSPGVRCVAIPIYGQSGNCDHAISVSGVANTFVGERLEKMIKAIIEIKDSLVFSLNLDSPPV
jgi:DNA-binding IclR family transcriptional regulator